MGLCNSINGGLDTGLTSGLIDYQKWINCYRYYVVDLSRRLAGMKFIVFDLQQNPCDVLSLNVAFCVPNYRWFHHIHRYDIRIQLHGAC